MKDKLNNTLAIGDPVVLIRPNYRELLIGHVTAFTAQYARIEYVDDQFKCMRTILQSPQQLIKTTEPKDAAA